jgi:hypothetical protein
VTYDVDLWVDDRSENLARCEQALGELGAEWGATEEDWGPVAQKKPGWTSRQGVFCLTSPHGAIDVFRAVKGLESWSECRARARAETTAAGVAYVAISDDDMLKCQLALPESERKPERIRVLKRSISKANDEPTG